MISSTMYRMFAVGPMLALSFVIQLGCEAPPDVGNPSFRPVRLGAEREASKDIAVTLEVENTPDRILTASRGPQGGLVTTGNTAASAMRGASQPGVVTHTLLVPDSDSTTDGGPAWIETAHPAVLATSGRDAETLSSPLLSATRPDSLSAVTIAQAVPSPSITITKIPPRGGGPDVMDAIIGQVRGADQSRHRVVIFSRTDRWYVQPYVSAPFTTINPDGSWRASIHLGDEYAAILVDPSYRPPATTLSLPELAGGVLAITRVTANR